MFSRNAKVSADPLVMLYFCAGVANTTKLLFIFLGVANFAPTGAKLWGYSFI